MTTDDGAKKHNVSYQKIGVVPKGFALPTVVIAGLVLLIIGASGLQAAGSSTRAVVDQSWNSLAYEAKESGIKYIESCLRDSNDNTDPARPWTQTLTQATDCQGGVLAGAPSYIHSEPAGGNSPGWRTSFAATAPANNTTLDRRVTTITGKVEILSVSGIPIRSYTSVSTVVLNVQGAQLGVQVAKVVSAPFHTCALLTNNKVYCAGSNSSGAIGQSNYTTNYVRPVDISPYPNSETALDVSLGFIDNGTNGTYEQTCVLSSVFRVYCIGRNEAGAFGNGASAAQNPFFVPSSGNVAFGGASPMTLKSSPTLTNGRYSQNVCAIATDDIVWCSGINSVAQLGNGTTANSSVPVEFNGIPTISGNQQKAVKVVQVPSDATSGNRGSICVLTDAGKVYCHGANTAGQAGIASVTSPLNNTYPVEGYTVGIPVGEGPIVDFGAGHQKTCALYTSGALYCAGRLPDSGAASATSTPARFGGSANRLFSDFTLSSNSICATETSTNDVYCISQNNYGQLGTNNTTANRDINNPTKVSGSGSYAPGGSYKLADVQAGDAKICLHYNVAGSEDTTGILTCAGRNNNGQLGVGNTTNRTTFGSQFIMPSGVGVKKLFLNHGTSLASRGATITDADTSGNYNQTCVLGTDGNAYCAGYNIQGQLGDLSTTSRSTPVKFVLPTNP